MAIVSPEDEDVVHGQQLEDEEDVGGHGHLQGGEHETADQRDRKERLALWLFIGGDAFFLVLELFTWFYLRALNTDGMWRGAACTVKKPCTDGLGNPITQEIAKANPAYTIVIALLAVGAALIFWAIESAARREEGGRITSLGAGALVVLLAVVVVQCVQFGSLPFTTIDGAYASAFEFFMGSTLAHLLLLSFIGLGVLNRARLGRYEGRSFYHLRLVRMFAVWIAASVCVLALVMSLFA